MSDPLSASEIRERATQLIAKWREEAVRCHAKAQTAAYPHVFDRASTRQWAMNECADELAELLALLASRETPRQAEEDLSRIASTRLTPTPDATAGKD
jgi:hypothetical protein